MNKINLKNIRKKHNYNQSDFAKFLDIKPRTYASWERGENNLPIDIALKIADEFDLTLDEIYGHDSKHINLELVTDTTLRMLLSNYKKLNRTGQQQLLIDSRTLTYNPDYKL